MRLKLLDRMTDKRGPRHFRMQASFLRVLVVALSAAHGAHAYVDKIYFTSVVGGNSEIFRMNADGTNRERITTTTVYHEERPQVSPDGKTISCDLGLSTTVFCEQRRVGIMNIDGTGLSILSHTPACDAGYHAWFTDGSRVVYSFWSWRALESDPYSSTVSSVLPDGTGRTDLFSMASADFGVWGAHVATGKILFLKGNAFNSYSGELWVRNIDGSNPVQIDGTQGYRPSGGAISPNGSFFIGTWGAPGSCGGSPDDIYRYNNDGSGKTELTNAVPGDSCLAGCGFSPNGNQIVFARVLSGESNSRIFLINTVGGTATPITDGTAHDYHPTWVRLPDPTAPGPSSPSTEPSPTDKITKGHIIIAPNRLDLSSPSGKVKFHLKGDAGGVVTIRIYDAAGRYMGETEVTLNSGGVATVEYGLAGFGGYPPAAGAYWALATGGGVDDRKLFFVTKKGE